VTGEVGRKDVAVNTIKDHNNTDEEPFAGLPPISIFLMKKSGSRKLGGGKSFSLSLPEGGPRTTSKKSEKGQLTGTVLQTFVNNKKKKAREKGLEERNRKRDLELTF